MIICDRCSDPLPNGSEVQVVTFNNIRVFGKHLCTPCGQSIFLMLERLGDKAEVDD